MRRLKEHRLESVVSRIYEAAVEPALWRPVLHDMADALGAESSALFSFPLETSVGTHFSPGIDPLVDWFFNDGTQLHNPRPERAMRFRSSRRVVTESQLFSEWELKHVPFNVEMIDRLGYRWDAGGVFTEIDGTPLLFTAQRRTGEEGFGRPELDAMQALFPHLERAAQIAAQLSRARADGMLDAFEQMACASVLIDAQGRVIRMNRSAEGLLGRGICVAGGCLSASDQASDPGLQQLLTGIVGRGPRLKRDVAPSVAALERQGGRPLAVYAMPIVGEAHDIFRRAKAILVIVDPDSRRDVIPTILVQSYHLTPSEVRLALALAGGKDLKTFAEEHRVSLGTARVQLKSVMAKMDTRRQADLMTVLARLALVPRSAPATFL